MDSPFNLDDSCQTWGDPWRPSALLPWCRWYYLTRWWCNHFWDHTAQHIRNLFPKRKVVLLFKVLMEKDLLICTTLTPAAGIKSKWVYNFYKQKLNSQFENLIYHLCAVFVLKWIFSVLENLHTLFLFHILLILFWEMGNLLWVSKRFVEGKLNYRNPN